MEQDFVSDEIISHITSKYKSKASQFKALKNELYSLSQNEAKASKMAKQLMKELNPIQVKTEQLSFITFWKKWYSDFIQQRLIQPNLKHLMLNRFIQYFSQFYDDHDADCISESTLKSLVPEFIIKDWRNRIKYVLSDKLLREFLDFQLFKSHIQNVIRHNQYQYQYENNEEDFLRACINFNDIKHNIFIFISGYIRNYIKLYIPMDVGQYIMNFCYKFNYDLLESKDKWNFNKANRYQKSFDSNLEQNSATYCGVTTAWNIRVLPGTLEINQKLTRKIWKVQVVKNHNNMNNAVFTFGVGIDAMYSSADCKKFRFYMSECKNCGVDNVKEGDIISILFIGFNEYGLVKFAVNDTVVRRGIIGGIRSNSTWSHRFIITMKQKETVKLLQ